MVYLVMEVGVGKTLATITDRGRTADLTENGVVLVYTDETKSEVLTAYLASVDRAHAIYHEALRQNGFTFVRTYLDHIDKVNATHCKRLNAINKKFGYHEDFY